MIFSELLPKVEQSLLAATGASVRLDVEWIAPDTVASHVARIRTISGGQDLPDTLIVKAANPAFGPNAREMLFNDWAALAYLTELPTGPLAPRFYAGAVDPDIPFVVMEDLGAGAGSPDEILHGSNPDAAAEALLGYASVLGRLHGCSTANLNRFRELREALPCPPRRHRLYHHPWSNASTYPESEIRGAIDEYNAVLLSLGVQPAPGVEDEIEEATRSVEERPCGFLALCQGDQNSTRQCLRHGDRLRMIDFGEGGLRHALIEGVPHRMTWGCVYRVPRSLFLPLEEAYRKAIAVGCPPAADEAGFRQAMVTAGARWNVFQMISRIPEAIHRDRPRGEATLRQQVLAWLGAFVDISDECGGFPALARKADQVRDRLRSEWPGETHEIPYAPAFRSLLG